MSKDKIIHIQHWKSSRDRSVWHRAILMASDGGACVLSDYPIDGKPLAYIYGLQVDKQLRKGGIATDLMNTIEQHLNDAGIERIQLEYDAFNSPRWELDWYLRRGYTEIEYGDNRCLMEKKLK